MSTFFITLFIVFIASIATIEAQICGPNEVWGECDPCLKTCENIRNPDLIRCTGSCITRCKCRPGYIRLSRRVRHCVREEEC
ncbi:chymotrypsin inhibitor Ani s 6-like [Leptopilina boulardi]|uniref:chymotrypsin inhibitor Ani s 6-like n=1 Tax=Leptopilina boulardi TaxID=63433 RepID=UPI0021F6236D|nr:chymotrypsin inhibitor Ani s 6-like [Leptopilina boulardi]